MLELIPMTEAYGVSSRGDKKLRGRKGQSGELAV